MSYFGTLLAGAVAVPLDSVSLWDHVRYALEQTRARIIFTFPQGPLSQLQEIPFLEKIVVVGETGESGGKIINFAAIPAASASAAGLPPAHPDDLASILFYLGHHRASQRGDAHPQEFFRQLPGHRQLNAIRPGDNMLAILPLHHALPFTGTLLLPLLSRAKITFLDTLQAEAILRCIKGTAGDRPGADPPGPPALLSGQQRQLARLPWALRPVLLAYLKFSRRVSQFLGVNPAGPLHRKFRGRAGRAVWVLCQRRGRTARVSGGGPGPVADLRCWKAARPHGDRAGGDLQPAGERPPGVRGAAPGRGGSPDS